MLSRVDVSWYKCEVKAVWRMSLCFFASLRFQSTLLSCWIMGLRKTMIGIQAKVGRFRTVQWEWAIHYTISSLVLYSSRYFLHLHACNFLLLSPSWLVVTRLGWGGGVPWRAALISNTSILMMFLVFLFYRARTQDIAALSYIYWLLFTCLSLWRVCCGAWVRDSGGC